MSRVGRDDDCLNFLERAVAYLSSLEVAAKAENADVLIELQGLHSELSALMTKGKRAVGKQHFTNGNGFTVVALGKGDREFTELIRRISEKMNGLLECDVHQILKEFSHMFSAENDLFRAIDCDFTNYGTSDRRKNYERSVCVPNP